MEERIKQAQALYDNHKYLDAINLCLELIKENPKQKDAYAIAAKSFVFALSSPFEEEKIKTMINVFGSACAQANTIEEVLELERDMTDAVYQWKHIKIIQHISKIEEKPDLEEWKRFINSMPKYIEIELYVSLRAANCPAANSFCTENGIEKKEFRKLISEKYGDKYEAKDPLPSEKIKEILAEVAQCILANCKTKLEANADGNKDFVIEVSKVITKEVSTAYCIASYTIPKEGKEDEHTVERLLIYADAINFLLTALIYPNGTPYSMYMGSNREEYVQELDKVYKRITSLDPDFIPPQLPDAAIVKPNSSGGSSSGGSSSGGCYVATAVYGSYDCPEVWTLRRFRDDTLGSTWYGRLFIRTYYAISPTLVKWFGSTEWFKNLWKPTLDRMVRSLNARGVEDTAYNDKDWRK